MDLQTFKIGELFRRYRKPLILAVVGLTLTMTLVVMGAAYAAYKTVSFATHKVTTLQPGVVATASELPAQASGFVEGVVLHVASDWLQQGAASGEVAKVKNGLACFDALGGPSPTEIVGYVQRTVSDTKVATQLQDLSARLSRDGVATNGPAACASWLLNG